MKQTVIWLVILSLAFAGLAMAQPMKMRQDGPMADMPNLPPGKWWRVPEVMENLKMTKEEQAKLDEMFVETQRKLIDFRGRLDKENFELNQLLEKKEFDADACLNQFKKSSEQQTNISTEQFRFTVMVRKLLGFERYQSLKTNYHEWRREKINEMRKRKDDRKKEGAPPVPPEKPDKKDKN